jgi:hypothetical protein
VRAQHPQVHRSMGAAVRTASRQHFIPPDPRSAPQATSDHQTHSGASAASQQPAACTSSLVRCFSAAAAQPGFSPMADQQRSESRSPRMIHWAGYSSSAAFVSEHGGGSFRMTAVGGEAGAAHGARLHLLRVVGGRLCLRTCTVCRPSASRACMCFRSERTVPGRSSLAMSYCTRQHAMVKL